MRTKHLPFFSALILSLLIIPEVCMAGASKAVADGSFVQAWLCGSWTEARWQQELTAMKNAGMHYLVIGPVAECAEGEITKTLYPSSLPNTEMVSYLNGKDMVDICLKNAESAGIKVFISLSSNSLWWSTHGDDTTWLYEQMKFDNKVCDEVWSLYKNKYPNAFYGWYWSYEVDNASFASEAQQDELITAMNIQLDHLSSANEKLPFMWCPFMNSKLGTSDEYRLLWQNVFSKLHTTAGDIFAPQDCVGAGGLSLGEVAEWFSALRQAVDTKPGLLFWSDVETFIQSDWTSATIGRIVSQLKIEQQYVDNFITFAYCHYQSPYNTDPGFQATYIDYLNNGSLETTPPTVPANFTAVLQTNGNVLLNWEASTDNIGVCGYYVYRNGTIISKKQVSRLDGAASITPITMSLTDVSLNPNTDYSYQVKAYDFANNISETSPIIINTGNAIYLSNKISVGRPYTVSIPASTEYPDENGTTLTNGSYARLASIGDQAWEGVYDADKNTRDIVIDLGRSKVVQQFIADYLYVPSVSAYLPAQVKVSVSMDNVNYSDVGNLALPNVSTSSSASSYKCLNTLSSAVGARYVKFSVTPGGSWTYADEYEIRNNLSTDVETGNEIPDNYLLSQNYPNPFNPATTISYRLPKSSYVTLKVFNVLGREVKTLVNKEQNAGVYNVLFDASGLSSGVYFYKLTTGNFSSVKKLTLVK